MNGQTLLSLLLIASLSCFHQPFASGQVSVAVTVPTSGSTAQFNVATGPTPISPRGSGFHTEPFQQIFWILDDGNYRWVEGETFQPGVPATPLFNHNYLAGSPATDYFINAIVIDRKTDTAPPSRLVGEISYSPPLSPTGGGFRISGISALPPYDDDYIRYTNSLLNYATSPTERVALINSHFFTPNLPESPFYYIEDQALTAFTLAFSPQDEGILLFFYVDDDEFNDATTSFLPTYGNTRLSGSVTNGLAKTYEIVPDGPYHKTLEYKITGADLNIDRREPAGSAAIREELRLFHLLSANDVGDDVEYPFMVMLGSKSFLGWSGEPSSVGHSNFMGGDSVFVSNYVDKRSGMIGNTQLYFVDAARIFLKGGEPKDPNDIRVTNICRCCDDSSCDDYLVSFELYFHNTEEGKTESANIMITDHSGVFDCFRLANIDPFTVSNGSKEARVFNWGDCAGKRCSSINYNAYDAKFCVGGYTLGINEFGRLRFTARTNAIGLRALLKDNALEAFVEFHEICCTLEPCYSSKLDTLCLQDSIFSSPNDNFCFYNKKDRSIWDHRNDVCAPICPICCNTLCCVVRDVFVTWPLFSATAVVLVLAALVYFIRKRRIMSRN